MNKYSRLVCVALFISVFSVLSSSAMAKDNTTKKSVVDSYTPIDPPSYTKRWGVGFASATNIIGADSALAAWCEVSPGNAIQGYFSVMHTTPRGAFGVGGIFKHTLVESQNAGLHIGGGLGIASVDNKTATGSAMGLFLNGVAGIHIELPSIPHVRIEFDGGPSFVSVDGNSNFQIASVSPLLGITVLYMF